MEEKQKSSWIFDLEEFFVPTYEQWEQTAITSLKGKPFEKLFTMTEEGIRLNPIYLRTKEGKKELELISSRSDNAWVINQELTGDHTVDLISSIHRAKKNGQTAIHFQLKTEDSSQGVDIKKLEDIKEILKTSETNDLTLFVDTKLLQGAFLSGLLLASQEENKKLTGVVGHDPIGEWVKHGYLPTTLDFYYDEMVEMVQRCKETQPELRTILVNSHPYHNGGATVIQELAYSLLTGIEYVRQGISRGLTIDELAPRIAFSFSVSSNMFMEIAKLRAANLLWSSIIKEFGGSDEHQRMWVHAKNSSATKTAYDPYVNMLRATIETFSAVVAGADSIQTSPYDEAFQQPTPFSERIARNVQSILMDEAYLGRVVDPSKGSWYIESLTKQVAEKSWEMIQELEGTGGIAEGLRTGVIQQEIQKTREDRFKKIEARKEKIVGVNMYANVLENEPPQVKEVSQTNREKVIRNQKGSLTLKDSEKIESNLKKGLSLNEIQLFLLKDSTESEIEMLPNIRWSMKYEELRNNAALFHQEKGKSLTVSLVNLGKLAKHKPRTDFIKGFFEVGGFHIKETKSISSLEELKDEPSILNEKILVLCGDDLTYNVMGLQYIEFIKQVNPNAKLYIAGLLSKEILPDYLQAGLSDCIHIQTNCYQFLAGVQKELLEEGRNENA